MPTVIVNKESLCKFIGKNFSDEQFDELCFEFGIELDEVTSEKQIFEHEQKKVKDGLSEEVLYKIEIPANRYDLLCLEGLAISLRTFLQISDFPKYKISSQKEKFIVHESVKNVRPFACSAVLRNIKFTEESLIRFMELQEKLHNNICRGRSLVSMGTHDLDSVKGPFHYKALKPEEIKFRMLNRTEETSGSEILSQLSNDPKLKYFTHLLEHEPLYPVVTDSQGIVMALPPMINSEHSKIKTTTRNVFIDITAKDVTKANIVLNTLVAMFSYYCEDQFTIEQVEVLDNGESILYPDITPRLFYTNSEYLTKLAGVNIETDEITRLLNKMGLNTSNEGNNIKVEVPITRSDIIHPCDIAEDLAISYGFNNIKKCKTTTVCNGYQQPINKLTDLIRLELSFAGYIESLTMALISKKDLFTNMLQEINEEVLSKTVQIFKSKTTEFEVFRNSLIPGIMKTISSNKTNPLPYKIFEISDIVLINDNDESGAINRRKLCFAYANNHSGFEVIHGMVDHLMEKLGLAYNDKLNGYYIEPSFEKIFFEDRQANIFIKGVKVGTFGIVHPQILKNFEIKFPVSLTEIDIEHIFNLIINGEILKSH